MAVLIRKNPNRVYQSIGSIEVAENEKKQADNLDAFLEQEIDKLVNFLTNKKIMPEKKGKGTLEAYWEMGKTLRTVVESKHFIEIAELPLLWINAKIYIPQELLYEDRGPYREHLWYCYRLASFPKELVQKMKWGEWVTIFDSSGINQESRFDNWFIEILNKQSKIERAKIRIFAPCINALLKNIDYSELTESELYNCYAAAWHITIMCFEAQKAGKPTKTRNQIQAGIYEQLGILDSVMDGSMTSYEYATAVLAN